MRFVFVTDELPRTGAAGHLALNASIIDWLRSQGHSVTILLIGARLRWPVEHYTAHPVTGPAVLQFGAYVVAARPWPLLRILAKAMADRLPRNAKPKRLTHGGADAVLGAFITPAQSAWCAKYITTTPPDAVLVDTIFRARLLREPALAGINSVIIAHDVFHRRHGALTAAGYRVYPASLSRAAEADLLNGARSIAAIQPDEAAAIRAMCPARDVFIAPMPAIPCPRSTGTDRLPDRLVFVGSASLPNLDGLRWFFAEIWPALRRSRPAVTLDLVGDCGAGLPHLPGVEKLGRVRGLAEVLHRAALAIAPLRVGSGLKIKLLDYARHGLMTVATPASLAGFAPDAEAPFIAAADAAGFIADIIRQLDAGPIHDARALAYVARHYGVAASFAGLGAALHLTSSTPVPAGTAGAVS